MVMTKHLSIKALMIFLIACILILPVQTEKSVLAAEISAPNVATMKINPNGDEYLVGAINCSMWTQGTHYGWEKIDQPQFQDRKPLSGWYDENDPGYWDWAIKWCLEHGINYMATCWYRGQNLGEAVTNPYLTQQTITAMKTSQYMNQFKYCLMWEPLGKGCLGLSDWETNIWPEWRDNHFSYNRYLVVDNKPVLYIFNASMIPEIDQIIARLKTLCQSMGFSGAYVITHNGSGGDYSFDYAFGNMPEGAAQSTLISTELNSYNSTKIANLSMGWDNGPWNDAGNKFRLTGASYEQLAAQTKAKMDSYSGSPLSKRMVLLGCWNEFGEGHVIQPTEGWGFDYLNAIRNVFTTKNNTPDYSAPQKYEKRYYNPEAYWKFNESAGNTAADSSPFGHSVALQNNPVWQPTGGKYNGCLEFNGVNQWVKLADYAANSRGFLHEAVADYTVMMWVKANTTTGTQILFEQGNASNGWALRINNGVLQATFNHAGDENLPVNIISTAYPNDGGWHHVAMTFNMNDDATSTLNHEFKLFLDGVEKASTNTTEWLIGCTPGGAGLGARNGSDAFGDTATGGYFNGRIDEVQIYPKHLHAEQIQAVMSGEGVLPPAMVQPGVNLALNKTATASTYGADSIPSHAVDGNESSLWCATSGTFPQWLKIDLGSPSALNRIKTTFYANELWKYKIEGSSDNNTWTVLTDKTSTGVTAQTVDDAVSGTYRYIRITITGSGGDWACIRDLEIYGLVNLSLNKTATASTYGADSMPGQSIDGNESSIWCATSGTFPQWLKIDLGGPSALNSIKTTFYANELWKYKIEGSSDNNTWTVLTDKTSAGVIAQTVTDTVSGTYRYIRITITGSGGDWACIREFEAYGT